MSRSTCWSLLAFAMALVSYVMHRDISANVFLATLFIIQGLKSTSDGEHTHHWDRIRWFVVSLSLAIILFAIWSLIVGFDFAKPRSW